ncbi:MAG TPA: hypothetical protein VMT52_05025 [Planctomycetota bacterium]|nr:hypothetical protein [Planctomycetota bacterium]
MTWESKVILSKPSIACLLVACGAAQPAVGRLDYTAPSVGVPRPLVSRLRPAVFGDRLQLELFTQRGRSRALPIRPTSPTRFLYEGSVTWFDFVIGEKGKVEGMRMHLEGAEEAERAEKVE